MMGMTPVVILLWAVSLAAVEADPSGPHTCGYTVRGSSRYRTKTYRACGWLWRSRCTTSTNYHTNYNTINRKTCCVGSRLSGSRCVVDCAINSWGGWSSCSDSCNPGTQARYRSIIRSADNGGYACPSNSESKPCNVGYRRCNIDSKCWTDKYISPATSSTCRFCDAAPTTRHTWQLQSGAKCDDKSACTKNDVCRSGACSGSAYTCKSCEQCNGVGCTVKRGFCLIQGQCYNHNDVNPRSPQCQVCHNPISWSGISSGLPTSWTNQATGTRCTDSDDCTRNDQCDSNGQCQPGDNYEHECAKPCQACSAAGTCTDVLGCEINGKCGCKISGTCHSDRTSQPGVKCHHCNFGLDPYSWSRMPDGNLCNDDKQCSYQDECTAGVCRGKDYTCPIGGPCMAGNTCNGKGPPLGCTSTYNGTSDVCYHRQDACDHPDTGCTGSIAACPHTSMKLLNGTPIVLGSIALRLHGGTPLPTGPINHFNLGSIPGNFLNNNASLVVELHDYGVPCGHVTYNITLYHMQTSFTIPSGGIAVMQANRRYAVTAQSPAGATTLVPISTSFLQNNVYRLGVSASNVRKNTLTSASIPFLVDATGPTFSGVIYDGETPQTKPLFRDIDFQSNMTSLSIHWPIADLQDKESGIDIKSYRMSVGTSLGSDDIISAHACKLGDISNGRCTVSGLNLHSGTKYYSNLHIANMAGLISNFTSNGVTPDNSPPETGQLALMLPRDLSSSYLVQNTASLNLSFQLSSTRDPESYVKLLAWHLCDITNHKFPAVCSTQGFKEFVCPTFPCTPSIHQPVDKITSPPGLLDDHTYQLRIRITNGAGLTSETSQSFRVDLIPPTAGTVMDGLSGDLMYQSSNTDFSAHWQGFSDTGTGINRYEWAIFRKDKTAVTQYSNVGHATSATSKHLHLAHGEAYTACVKVVDNADNNIVRCSNGLTIDSAPPAPGTVLDIIPSGGLLTDIDYQADATKLRSRWHGFAAASGIASYSWGVGTKPGLQNVVSAQSYGLADRALKSGLNLTSGVKYYAVVVCKSRSGLTTTVSSDGVTVDTSPPTTGLVFDLCSNGCSSKEDVNFTSNNMNFSVRWKGFSDSESGIEGYYWNYGYCGSDILLRPSDVYAGDKTESSTAVAVTTSVRYCVQVRAVNKAGLSAASWSDGMLVDITPPDNFFIVDGSTLRYDSDHQSSSSSLTATWSTSSDQQSGLSHVTIAIGLSPLKTDLQLPIILGNSLTSFSFTSLQLNDLTEYYVTVCFINNAKLSTCRSTDGVLIDTTAPTMGIVLTGESLKGRLYQSSTSTLTARWSAFEDAHSDIAEFRVAAGVTANHQALRNFASVGLRLSTTLRNLTLQSGTMYTVSVEAVNNANLTVTSRSTGITVDDSAPLFQQKPIMTLNGTTATLAWPGVTDPESSIWYYRWALGVSCNGNQLFGYMNAANGTTSIQHNLHLTTGQAYYGTVVARNRAGISSHRCSDPVVFDGTPPLVPQVTIGSAQSPLHYLSSSSTVPCSWSPATDRESGVVSCTMTAIDVSSGAILGWVALKLDPSSNSSSGSEHVNAGLSKSTTTTTSITLPTPSMSGSACLCRMACTNGVGLSAVASSGTATFDVTPPSPGHVNIPSYWSSSENLNVTWKPCTDLESGITNYHWSVVSKSTNATSLSSTDVGLSLEASSSMLAMAQAGVFVVTVACTNGAGHTATMTSQEFTIDTTPPSAAKSVTAGFNLATDTLFASWPSASDNESGILGYEWSIGVSPGGCQVLQRTFVGNVHSAKCSNCSLKPGEEYYISVLAVNHAMLITAMPLVTVVVDTSPPIAGSLHVVSYNAMKTSATLGCKDFRDDETSIQQCSWTLKNKTLPITTNSTGCNCQNCAFDISLPTVDVFQDPFTFLSVDVACKDFANLTAMKTLQLDTTAPVKGSLKCSRYSRNVTAIRAVWSGFYDPQSPVDLRWSVGHQGLSDILPWTIAGMDLQSSQVQAAGLSLLSGEQYTVTLEAISKAGWTTRQSCITTVDTTPPVGGAVLDGPGAGNLNFVAMPSTLSASWSGFSDAESPLSYTWCVGLARQKQNVMSCRYVGSATNGACRTCKMDAGVTYYVTVRASNGAGLVTSVSSDGVMLDTSPPRMGSVSIGSESAGSTPQYVTGDLAPAIFWTGFSDQQSGIQGCSVSILAGNGSALWLRPQAALSDSPLSPNITLPVGQRLSSEVTCKNRAGLSMSSNSVSFILDRTAPVTGSIKLQWISVNRGQDALQIACSGFEDPESPIASFDVTVANAANSLTMYDRKITVLNSTFTVPVSNLSDGERYSVTVIATNQVGLSSQVTSSPLIYDGSPPSVGSVLDGPADGGDFNYTSRTTRHQAHWETIADPESGIHAFYWAVGTSPGGTQVLRYTPVGRNTSSSCGPPQCSLVDGLTYFTTVRAENGAGKVAWFTSDGMTVDNTTPSTSVITLNNKTQDEIVYANSNTSLDIKWQNGSDPDSPITDYSVCFGSSVGLCDVQQWQSTGLSTVLKLPRIPNITSTAVSNVFVNVKVSNAAGLFSVATSSRIHIDNTSPEKGQVIDGHGMSDTDCQDASLPLAAQWSGFVDKESYIVDYQWALGSQPYSDNIHKWTSAGLNVSAEIPSASLAKPLDMLFVAVRATNGAGLSVDASSDGVRIMQGAGAGATSELASLCVSYTNDLPP